MDDADGFGKRIWVAAPGGIADRLGEILTQTGYPSHTLCTSGAQVLEQAKEQPPLMVVVTQRLSDMTGAELIMHLGEETSAILILPQGETPNVTLPESVVVMHNPLSKDVFVQTVHVLARMSLRVHQLNREVARLERMLTERKLIDRAKGRLMDEKQMSESDAHHYIQKRSMDSGKRLAEVAREILEEQMAG